MAIEPSCKGCREEYKVNDEQIARLLAKPMFASENCVPDDIYQMRMESCGSCSKLQDGVTCMMCGCIMPVATKMKVRSCPLPGASKRWDSVK